MTASRLLSSAVTFAARDSRMAAFGTNMGRSLAGAAKALRSRRIALALGVYSRLCLGGKTRRRGSDWAAIGGKRFWRAGCRLAPVRSCGDQSSLRIARMRCSFSISPAISSIFTPTEYRLNKRRIYSTVAVNFSGADSTAGLLAKRGRSASI